MNINVTIANQVSNLHTYCGKVENDADAAIQSINRYRLPYFSNFRHGWLRKFRYDYRAYTAPTEPHE